MDLFQAIAQRYSYRGPYTAAPVPRTDLVKIVEAGIHAPSAKNEQVTSFVIVDDPQLVREIAQIIDRPNCLEAQALIVVASDPRPVVGDLAFSVEDCSACVQNMLLAITALRYASVWIDGALRRDNRAARIGNLLCVPPDWIVRVILPVGVAAEPADQKPKLPFEQRAWFNRRGG